MFKEYFQYKGISFPRLIYSERGLREVENEFQVRDDDVFNVTYQKSGTVWMLEILSLIHSNGDPSQCRTVPNWNRGPWYETVMGLQTARSNRPPRLISSHLPIQLFAKSFFRSKAKIFRPYKEPGQLDQFLEQFLEGDVPFGSWFDHVKGWMGLRGHENFFWITYEELQQDLRGSVERICQFLGKPLDARALDGVVENASFQAMKQNKMCNFSLAPRFLLDQTQSSFLRKGITGDWKNQLTTAQSENFDRIYREQMQGLDLSFPWDQPSPQPSPPPTECSDPSPGGS
ncbi:sulfotransferase 2B1 isoform X2 [Chrysemys picta bellii]|uniref:sulfotransferase 2B1 isoform X2 n=1 Tax=Chrysemys picta bellii TaxID=8478 RepID=UPI0032B1A343